MTIPADELSLQDRFASQSICFGCGPSNPQGLQIKSFVKGDQVIAHFTPKPYHHAFPGILNGGIIAAILDCHCNWSACWYLMQKNQLPEPPCTVTAELSVQLKKPTPVSKTLTLVAELIEASENKATIKADLLAGDQLCDTFLGTFVSVKPDHPAYHRW